MGKSRSFFRNLSRTNSVLNFIALVSLIVLACVIFYQEVFRKPTVHNAEPAESAVAGNEHEKLQFQRQYLDTKTGVVRMALVRLGEGKFGSGGGTETANLLFIPADQTVGHWLLTDNKHVLESPDDINDSSAAHGDEAGPLVASAVLVSPKNAEEGAAKTLLLFDPTGTKVTEVSRSASETELAEISNGQILLVYSVGPKFYRATFDRNSLQKTAELEVTIPKLK